MIRSFRSTALVVNLIRKYTAS